MLHYFKLLVFILFFDFIFSTNNINITEGVVDVEVEVGINKKITFNAVENGTFLILFGVNATIIEATGNISNDLIINRGITPNPGYETKVYSQNFIEGDSFTIYYPSERSGYSYNAHISIKKIDAQFSLLQYTQNTFIHIFYDNCQHPLYIFATNDKIIHKRNEYFAYIQNHFGEFKANYLIECFNSNLDFEDDSLFSEMKNDSLTNLPICDINLIKLQCSLPSLFSFYFAKNEGLFSFFYDLKIITQPISFSSHYHFYEIRLFYFQFFNLVGNTSVDFTDFGDKIYNGEDFYLEYYYPEESKYYAYKFSNTSNTPALSFSISNNGRSKCKIAKENEKTLFERNFIIKLNPNKNKKYIKIISTVHTFYYCYTFSQTEDLNYLPSCGMKYWGHEYITYLNNPYYYNNNKTNYVWFIVIDNYVGEEQFYTYQYANRKWEDEQDEDEKEKEKEKGTDENIEKDTKTSFASTFLWIFVVLIIGIIIVFTYFYINKRKNTTTNEILLDKIENKELTNVY